MTDYTFMLTAHAKARAWGMRPSGPETRPSSRMVSLVGARGDKPPLDPSAITTRT